MKPIKVEHEDLKRTIQNGHSYIEVDNKKYLLLEVEEVNKNDCYTVSDPIERSKLLEALNQHNPILSDEEINKMLRR